MIHMFWKIGGKIKIHAPADRPQGTIQEGDLALILKNFARETGESPRIGLIANVIDIQNNRSIYFDKSSLLLRPNFSPLSSRGEFIVNKAPRWFSLPQIEEIYLGPALTIAALDSLPYYAHHALWVSTLYNQQPYPNFTPKTMKAIRALYPRPQKIRA